MNIYHASLKNFGVLYENPQNNDIRLSPLYDIVNTTCYLPKDTLALKMNKTKSWPDRATLIEFGSTHCDVEHPANIIDHIVDVASSYRPLINPGEIWKKMKPEIDKGCDSVRTCLTSAASSRIKML